MRGVGLVRGVVGVHADRASSVARTPIRVVVIHRFMTTPPTRVNATTVALVPTGSQLALCRLHLGVHSFERGLVGSDERVCISGTLQGVQQHVAAPWAAG